MDCDTSKQFRVWNRLELDGTGGAPPPRIIREDRVEKMTRLWCRSYRGTDSLA